MSLFVTIDVPFDGNAMCQEVRKKELQDDTNTAVK